MPQSQRSLSQRRKSQSIHELDRNRLDPANPNSVDPANTDPADEAEDAENGFPDPSRPGEINPDSIDRK